MLADLRYILRSLLRTKGFTLVTILTLALGIGSAAAIFSVVDWILFRSTAFPQDVVFVGAKDKQNPFIPVRMDLHLRAYEEQAAGFQEWARAARLAGNVVLEGEPIGTSIMAVSSNLMSMLGIAPVLGRGFLPGEDTEGRNQVVVISHEFWRRHFQASPDVLGRELQVNETVCTIVGVLRRNELVPPYLSADVIQPLAVRVNPAMPWDPMFFSLARLRPGMTPAQAGEALAAVKVELDPNLAPYFSDQIPVVTTLAETQKLYRPEIYWVLLGAVGFLYSIACLNATNLMLVRMLGRKRELSIRLALGGGRWRLIRLFLCESVAVAIVASGLGLMVANWVFPLFMALAGNQADGDLQLWSLDWRTVVVLGALTVVTSLAIVIVPALRILRTDIQAGLKDGGAALGESRRLGRLRGAFVVLQAAFAVVLLTGAGLMVRTFQNLREVNLGFSAEQRVKVTLGFPTGYVIDKDPRLALLRRLQEHLRRVPGVADAAYGTDVLLAGYYYAESTVTLADGTPIKVEMDYASSNFGETSGLTLKRGRWLDQSSGQEVLINEAFARVRYGDDDPIGQLLKPINADAGWAGWVVVGVVNDVRETVRAAPGYHVYGPETWYPPAMNTFILRLNVEPNSALTGSIRRAIYEFDPKIVAAGVSSLDETRDNQIGFERFALSVLKVLSGLAITLTVVGIFSVLAYTVDRRMSEFGLRLALGATARDLVRLVVSRGVVLVVIGILLGIGGALALTRYLQSLLFETPAYDPLVLGAVAFLLLLAAALACAVPALRATRADVARLLRAE